MKKFIGRERELALLNQYQDSPNSTFIVIRGRRRTGKSQLVEEFAKNHVFWRFSGLPLEEQNSKKNQKNQKSLGEIAQDQRDYFSNTLMRYTGGARADASDWFNLFVHLADQLPHQLSSSSNQQAHQKIIVLLDEISWMAMGDSTFLPKLKDAWDHLLKKNNQLIFILCGSVSNWIEKNILSSTGFFGRIHQTITLEELSLLESLELLESQDFQASSMEKLMVLSITGGIPWYLEQFFKGQSAEQHIRRLCFEKDGLFVSEFDRIFHDLYGSRAPIYLQIINLLASGLKNYSEITEATQYYSGGTLSEYLDDLVISGFVTKDKGWAINTGLARKIIHYRLSDNYLRFYLKNMLPNLDKIQKGHFEAVSLKNLKGFSSYLGLQLENLVLRNKDLIFKSLGILKQDVVADGPFIQRKTKAQEGCQIDYLIQTSFNSLLLCEVKFSKNLIGLNVISEVQEKIKKLKKPRGFSCVPVLIYFGELSEEILDQQFFYKLISFEAFLTI